MNRNSSEYSGKRVLFFTDLHFGIHSNSQKYIDVCTQTVKWVGELCAERSISDVVFGGDFFDSRSSIDVRLMSIATQSLYGLADGGVHVHMVLGNHDIYLRDATDVNSLLAYGANENVTVYDRPTRLFDSTVLLLPWGYGTAESRIDVNGNEKTVFCHHGFPKEFFFGGGKLKKSDTDVSDDFSDFGIQDEIVKTVLSNDGNIFSGHIHHPSEIPIGDRSYIVIAGSPYETEFGFGNVPCGAYIVDVGDSSYEFVENPFNRKHVEIRSSEFGDGMLDKRVYGNFVRLVVDTQESFERVSEIQHAIAAMKPYHVLNTVFEFRQSAFVGGRDEEANPLGSVSKSALSKVDYVNAAIDKSDFSCFAYGDNGQNAIDKGELKRMAAEIFGKVRGNGK